MPSFYKLKPAGEGDPSREDLAAHVRKALNNIQGTLKITALIGDDEAEIAAINGACDFIIEKLAARADGVREAIRLRDDLVPTVVITKRERGLF
jgi:hypothetical protein